jgi:hypothetical protein
LVLYSAKVKPLPVETFTLTGSLNISFNQISLGKRIDGTKLVNTLKARLEAKEQKKDAQLSSTEKAELYLVATKKVIGKKI